MNIFTYLSFFVASTLAIKKDPTQLQIGIKRRIPADKCLKKTKNGDSVRVHYKGTLFSTGEEFDSSYGRGEPLEFELGQGRVIQGWDKGLLNMCINEQRKLVIPSSLAYGENGSPPKIPPSATLVFEVKLVNFNDIVSRDEEESAPVEAKKEETPLKEASSEEVQEEL